MITWTNHVVQVTIFWGAMEFLTPPLFNNSTFYIIVHLITLHMTGLSSIPFIYGLLFIVYKDIMKKNMIGRKEGLFGVLRASTVRSCSKPKNKASMATFHVRNHLIYI